MNSTDMRMPPLPSVMVWCSFWTIAARPSGRPSITVNSHRGRFGSSGARARSAARARTSESWEPGGRVTQRRWWSRSKSGSSIQLGVSGPRPGWTLRRRRGTTRLARHILCRRRSWSGARSKKLMLAKLEDRNGSDSRVHISDSRSLIGSLVPPSFPSVLTMGTLDRRDLVDRWIQA